MYDLGSKLMFLSIQMQQIQHVPKTLVFLASSINVTVRLFTSVMMPGEAAGPSSARDTICHNASSCTIKNDCCCYCYFKLK